MNTRDLSGLIAVFEDAAEALKRPQNDFAWSGWEDEAEAIRDVEAVSEQLRRSVVPDRMTMTVLFAPTGPIQEVSLGSGWGHEFLVLAARFDAELALIPQR